MILYGTNPIAWSNDDDRTLGADIPLERCLEEAAEIGFDGIEKGHKMPSDPGRLAEALAPFGLKFVSGWHSTNLLREPVQAEMQAIRKHLALLKGMGCQVCILCETSTAIHGDAAKPLAEKPVLARGDWKGFCDRLTDLALRIEDEGLTPVYHHHMGTVTQTRDEIDRLMDGTGDALKLLLDAGHAFFAGVDPVKLADDYMERTRHIHAKNVRPAVMKRVGPERMSFLKAVREGVFTVPGDEEGGVDFPPILKIAARQGYSGWLVIEAEQDPAVRHPAEYQGLGLRALKAMAREAGLDKEGAGAAAAGSAR